MRKYDKTKPLVSIHIPKAGGTSFRNVLKDWYGDKLYLHYFDEEKKKIPSKYTLDEGICIHGHFNKKRNFGIEDYYPEIEQFVTIIRDPFDIVVSRYFYVKRLEDSNKSFRNGESLILTPDVEKYLIEMISDKDYHPNILDYFPRELTLENYKSAIDEEFIYIGSIEDFEYSVMKISEKLGFTFNSPGHLNKTENKKKYTGIYKRKIYRITSIRIFDL